MASYSMITGEQTFGRNVYSPPKKNDDEQAERQAQPLSLDQQIEAYPSRTGELLKGVYERERDKRKSILRSLPEIQRVRDEGVRAEEGMSAFYKRRDRNPWRGYRPEEGRITSGWM